ncbi:MAG TPA: LacI family DNA-binding transcriptional regulator, partial [Anaerolineae bacterium]
MSTIRDVAKRAAVSSMTVSRVINNSGYVGKEARERVETAIRDLGYVPNTLARSLRFKRTKLLALILSDITNPYFTTIARGVEDTSSKHGFNVVLCNTDESAGEEERYLTALVQRQVDGVLLVPALSGDLSVAFCQQHNVPVVLVDRHLPGCHVDSVRSDSERGAYDLVRVLLDLGHRRIAALLGPLAVSTAVDRAAGYRRALAQAGLPSGNELIRYGQYNRASGYEMAQDVLQTWPRPTAIFAGNNFIAVGAYHALHSAGLSVPDDVALVAFDDLPLGLIPEPILTVAAQPAYEIGRVATELLLARLAGKGPAEPQEIVLATEVIVRRSSGRSLMV